MRSRDEKTKLTFVIISGDADDFEPVDQDPDLEVQRLPLCGRELPLLP